jgi:hypothetical protein
LKGGRGNWLILGGRRRGDGWERKGAITVVKIAAYWFGTGPEERRGGEVRLLCL